MTERKEWVWNILLWGAGIGLILLICKENQELISGIEIGSGAANVNFRAISLWLCLLLPLYVSVGFDLFLHKGCRPYLLIRYGSYRKWWNHWCQKILCQDVIYFFLLGTAWYKGVAPVDLICRIVMVQVMTSGVGLLLLLLMWERFLLEGSVLILCFFQMSLISFSYFMPETVRCKILPYLGMARYLTGNREAWIFVCLEVLLLAVLIFGMPKVMERARK